MALVSLGRLGLGAADLGCAGCWAFFSMYIIYLALLSL
jgi:hypothetical protein